VHHAPVAGPKLVDCGATDVRAFLESLAVRSGVAAATQNQACAAVQFLYQHVVGRALGGLPAYVRARRLHRLPNVLAPDEVAAVLSELSGAQRVVVMLLYGAGLRLNEALALRAKDVDVRRRTIMVRDGKGGKDRRTVLPDALVSEIEEQLRQVRRANLRDAQLGGIRIPLPYAMGRKAPSATTDWRWAWLFPATRTYLDPRNGARLRDHLHDSTIQRAKIARR
jgi:site-specific recombinase XerD